MEIHDSPAAVELTSSDTVVTQLLNNHRPELIEKPVRIGVQPAVPRIGDRWIVQVRSDPKERGKIMPYELDIDSEITPPLLLEYFGRNLEPGGDDLFARQRPSYACRCPANTASSVARVVSTISLAYGIPTRSATSPAMTSVNRMRMRPPWLFNLFI
jgi:hypothetical protein